MLYAVILIIHATRQTHLIAICDSDEKAKLCRSIQMENLGGDWGGGEEVMANAFGDIIAIGAAELNSPNYVSLPGHPPQLVN